MPRAPRVMLTGRVTDTQAAALRAYADEVGLPLYQATVRALELGIAALIGGRGAAPIATAEGDPGVLERGGAVASDMDISALREAVERLTDRAELTDRLVQRTLYASCASYAASIAAPGEGAEHLATIAADADRIFDRQLAKAREGL